MEQIVLFEDNDIVVISKPAGITVNRSDTTKREETVQDWAEERIGTKEPKETKERNVQKTFGASGSFDPSDSFYSRGGIVHRLDKETSGILLIAKNKVAFAHLQAQFKERTVKKRYTALAHGRLTPPDGEIRVPVGRLPWNRKQFGIVAGGREAVTRYKTISHFSHKTEALSLLEVYPETGRTHQIRVHLKYIGHPIFADFLYAGRKTARNDRKLLSRVFLHAAKISFLHPTTAAELAFESPLPADLQTFLNLIEKVD